MATAKREPAIRARLDPSTDAIVARTGVHLVRGRETFHLSDRAMDALAAEWTSRRDWLEALGAALRAETGRTGDGAAEAAGGREQAGERAGGGKE